jgi:hypothetical protein
MTAPTPADWVIYLPQVNSDDPEARQAAHQWITDRVEEWVLDSLACLFAIGCSDEILHIRQLASVLSTPTS